MKIISAVLFLILIVASPAFGQSKDDSERKKDSPNRKAVNGFGGHLIVVENPREFIQQWLKPETPKIKSVSDVKRGEQIGAFVLFAGCKQDAQGVCNSEVDYIIYKPDGSVYVERKKLPLWKEKAPPAPNIQLGKAILALRFGKDEPAGEYKIKAKVSDFNAEITFELEATFRLQEK
ncbi:MAG: hypothetical protein OEQ39_18180 [Gammaproteobacteria bacterium]|nr:hypothetical protein [Gammaproteobacteria bacterium]